MPLIDSRTARDFAEEWIAAWNIRDLDRVLRLCSDDLEFSSPLIAEIGGEPGGTLSGKAAVRRYWEQGLQRLPDLHFRLVDVLRGIDRVVLYYNGHRSMVAESFTFGLDRRVIRATACYAESAGCGAGASVPLSLPAIDPDRVPARIASIYPTEALRKRVAGRRKRALGDAAGLQTFGVNLVELAPRSISALRHWHTRQDEFIYVLQGELTLVTDRGQQSLGAGMGAGFPAGQAEGHQLVNRGSQTAVYLEVGDRLPGDRAYYPDEDLEARASRGSYEFFHTDGLPY